MKRMHVAAFVLVAATVRTFAALPANGLIAAGSYAEVTLTGQTNVAGLAVSGTLEKRGAGGLTLTNLYSLPGTVWAHEGTVTLVESGLPAALPIALQRGLAFWVDAATNVVLEGSSTVEKWLDAREASTNGPYAYMRAEHDFNYYSNGWSRARKPVRVVGNASVNGLPMVDFGTFGATNSNAAWLPWRKADGTRGVLTTIRAVFAVVAFPDSNGFLLSDWDYTDAGGLTNTVGAGHFWLGAEVQSKRYFRLFQSTSEAYKGTTYMNGVQVESGARSPDVLGHVFETLTAAPLTAANFFNGRNIDGYSGTFPHIGGGRIGECLIYTNALTEAERLAIESYLQRKWRSGGQVGAQRVEAGATLVSEAGAGTTNRISGITGEGRWRKTGPGAVSLANDLEQMCGTLQLEEGALNDDGFVRRPNRLFTVPDSGLVVRAETSRWEVLSAAATNVLVKTGAGELTVTGFPQSVVSVVVNGGTLRLTQALRDPERAEPVTIYNGSFEIFDNHNFHGQWPSASPELWGFEPAGSGWTYYGSPTASSSANAAGIYKPNGSAVVWCEKQPAPDGEWVALIKQGGGMATSFEVPLAGRYRLVFFSASRAGSYGSHRCNILIDGLEFAHMRPRRTLFERREFLLPWLSAGSHTLTFQGVNENNVDRTSLLDDVRIEKVETPEGVGFVSNGCFEVSAPVTNFDGGNNNDPGNYSYTYVVTNAGWTFGLVGTARSGITEDYSPFLSQRFAAEGTRCAFLMQQGVMSTLVSFPTNGVYDLSFLTAARFDWSIKDPANIYYNLHDYRIKLDGEQVGTWVTYKKFFERVTFRLPAITNAPVSKELRFEGINTLTGDRTSLFDDVRVTRLKEGDPLKDGRFELPAGALANGDTWESGITNTAWTFDLGAGMRNMSGITRNGSAWRCPNAPEGAAMAVLQMAANMSQPLAFAESGVYALSFMATGRMRDYPRYYLHDFRILFNGEQVGCVQTFDETWRRYTFRLPYVKAGVTNSLVFDGVNSMNNQLGLADDHASFIDDVRITKQTPVLAAGTPGVYKSVTVRLEAGSKLALDFPGQAVFKELWYDGQLYSGARDASNTAFLTGTGSVFVSPKGTLIRIQ